MPMCQTTAGCLCAANAQFGLDMDLVRIIELEDALREIAKMKPTSVGKDFVTGPLAMFNACQRIAREALQKSNAKDTLRPRCLGRAIVRIDRFSIREKSK